MVHGEFLKGSSGEFLKGLSSWSMVSSCAEPSLHEVFSPGLIPLSLHAGQYGIGVPVSTQHYLIGSIFTSCL
jgi:hypothetical protein